jgi:hypothetical protein
MASSQPRRADKPPAEKPQGSANGAAPKAAAPKPAPVKPQAGDGDTRITTEHPWRNLHPPRVWPD